MKDTEKAMPVLSKQAIQRFPYYLRYLKSLDIKNIEYISSSKIAADLNLYEVQVRKDLAAISSKAGKPRLGFKVENLITDIENFMGYNNVNRAVIVGAGHLGRALLSYKGFENYGLEIVAAFDSDEAIIGKKVNGKSIFPMEKLKNLCDRLNVHIGIITVPSEAAQSVCDDLVCGGVCAIWNFAQVHLNVPDNILVQNENMAASLAILSKHLMKQLNP